MYREQYTPHVLYILPTGAGYTAYISSEKKLHSAVSLTRFLPQKKKVCTAYTGYMIPSTYCSSISQHFAWPGGKFSMLNWQVPSLVAQRLTVKPSWCTAPMCFHRLGVSTRVEGVGDCEDRNQTIPAFFLQLTPGRGWRTSYIPGLFLRWEGTNLHVLCVVDRAFVWGGQLFQGYHPMVDAFCSTHVDFWQKTHAENPASMCVLV